MELTLAQLGLVFLAGVAAMAINAVVGSGTLITFPVLLWLGLPPVVANMSNTVGLATGGFSAIYGYRREVRSDWPIIKSLALPTLLGSAAGALLLIFTPEQYFETLVPFLIAAAVALVALQPALVKWRSRRNAQLGSEPGDDIRIRPVHRWATGLTGIYTGYFGAAQGIVMWGILGTIEPSNLQRVNAWKNAIGITANGLSAVLFMALAPGVVHWPAALAVLAGALVGGYVGSLAARRMSAVVLRGVILAVGMAALASLIWT